MAFVAALTRGDAGYLSATQRLAAPGVLTSPGALRAGPGGQADLAAARKAARQFVGETFFGLLLKELRKSTSKDHPLYGGRGEQTMQPVLDQFLARRLAESSRFALAEAMVEHICPPVGSATAAGEPRPAGKGAAGPTPDEEKP